jgi:hypothetical protein
MKKPSPPHVQLRNALLDDHVKKGWMDADMVLAYTIMLRHCDWNTGIWHGSADSLAALTGGQWSKPTAVRVLRRLGQGRYITSRHVDKVRGNYDIAINNFIPTIGENIGKKLRPTKTRDYRIRIKSDSDKWATDQDHQRSCTESPVIRNQECILTPPSESGVGVGSDERSESRRRRPPRIADAIAGASPRSSASPKTETQPQTQLESGVEVPDTRVEVPAAENEVSPVSQEDPSPSSAAPLPAAETEELARAYFEDPATYLATYLWSFLQHRADVEVIRPWERLWIQDFQSALDDGHTKEDIELAILCSQAGKAREMYVRALSICNNLDLLVEKGRKFRDKGVLREHECKCHALFAMLKDLREHQETCETALAIDPADAAEELAMWAAEDAACEEGAAPNWADMADPFAGEREGEDWQ